MAYIFNKSVIGYSHIKCKKPCQDFSASYKDNERIVITCCDGHGGDLYIRSNIGSKMASNATIHVLNSLSYYEITREVENTLINKIKLNLLCEWNKLIENEIGLKPIRKSECSKIDLECFESLKDNPNRAFGTTLTGAVVIGKKLVVVGIGDTEVIGIKNGQMSRLLEDENDPAANITYSMCQEDAFNYLRVKILNWDDFDGVLLCTDGLSSPYQSYGNFNNSFIKPIILDLIKTSKTTLANNVIERIATKSGIGDDVSLSFILKDNIKKKYYK